MPYICGVISKDILCSECAKHGKRSLLGKVERAEGVVLLWCKHCRAQVRVTITKDKIITEKTPT